MPLDPAGPLPPRPVPPPCHQVLVLQGGGALGSYQAGVYAALQDSAICPSWIAGISIGAINGALIAGNPPARRIERLRAFWERVTAGVLAQPPDYGEAARAAFQEASAGWAALAGVPGFFRPRLPPPWLLPPGAPGALSVYDTAPLRATLEELVDFDLLNRGDVRLSVGAVNIRTGNFAYFDNRYTRLGPEHIMASGALPPGFPPVEIEGEQYWDGGLVSNTPLQYVLDQETREDLLIFQVDLFSARGPLPRTVFEAQEREKDIRYSSRTRLNTDDQLRIHQAKSALRALLARLPAHLAGGDEVGLLRQIAQENAVTVVQLIHRRKNYHGGSKDYEFSRRSMEEHWASGIADVRRTLKEAPRFMQRPAEGGTAVFDMTRDLAG
jgi:NTE family protein